MADESIPDPMECGEHGHRCQYHVDCTSWDTLACVMDNDDKDPLWLCGQHAFALGHCCICGQFWGGIESFDFGPGYCEYCKSEVESDCYDPDDDDGYDDEDYLLPEYEG